MDPVAMDEIPLFPLGTPLTPGGRLPLRIFEPRYLDMVSRCMRTQAGFGVVLLRSGQEARSGPDDPPVEVFETGTLASIIDFNALDNGMLGIVCRGTRRFRVESRRSAADHLLYGQVRWLDADGPHDVPPRHAELVDLLRVLLDHPLMQRLAPDVDFADAALVSWRLVDALPVAPEIRQRLCDIDDAHERLDAIASMASALRARGAAS